MHVQIMLYKMKGITLSRVTTLLLYKIINYAAFYLASLNCLMTAYLRQVPLLCFDVHCIALPWHCCTSSLLCIAMHCNALLCFAAARSDFHTLMHH